MNTKKTFKAGTLMAFKMVGILMILSMVFGASLSVLGESIDWTEPEPPDQEPGGIVTIIVGDSEDITYDKSPDNYPVVEVLTGPDNYDPLPKCVDTGLGWWEYDGRFDESEPKWYTGQFIWTCEIHLDPNPEISVGAYTYKVTQGDIVELGEFTDAPPLNISPGYANVYPGNTQTYTATGGTPPYTFSVFLNSSDGYFTNNVYTAGSEVPTLATDVIDIVRVTDSAGKTADAYVFVGNYLLGDGQGETIEGPCVQDNVDFGLNCTANDVVVASVENLVIAEGDGCAFPGDTVTFTADYIVELNAQARYDIGLYFAIDGDPDGDASTGTCSITTLPYREAPTWLDLDGVVGGFQNTCGDVNTTNTPLSYRIELTAVCEPSTLPGYEGLLRLPYCASWDNTSGNICTSPMQAVPNNAAKCRCDDGFTVPIPIPGQIIVDKDTGDLESPEFGFTLSEYIEAAWVERATFDLAGQDPPYESEFLYAGLYKVEETSVPPGWTASDPAVECVSDMDPDAVIDPLAIDLNPGETITCTFYNEQNTGTIIIEKETIFGDGTFNFTSDELGPFSITTTSGYGSKTFEDKIAGTFSVFETVPAGWTLISATCEDDEENSLDPAEFILEPDATVTCTFVNKKQLADLTVTKTTVPTFTRTWDWDITKTATPPTTRYGTPGSLVEFGYSVEVDADKTDSAWAITGNIRITNPNLVAIPLLTLADSAGGVTCTPAAGPYSVPANSYLDVAYSCPTFVTEAAGTNTATATWNKDFYNTPTGTASGTAGYSFVTPTTEIDECIAVSDTAKGALGTVCAAEAPKTFTYNYSWTAVAGVCTDYPNTASFVTNDTGATDSDGATVTVCAVQDLTVSKTVDEAGYTKTWTWEIDKEYDGEYWMFAGESVDHDYLVSLTPTGTDSDWYVEGTITVTNPMAWQAVTLTSLVDTIPGGVCVLVDPPALVVPMSGSLTVNYRCTFAEQPAYTGLTNTATATWNAATYFTPTGTASGTADVDFEMTEEIGDEIMVSDTNWLANQPADANLPATWEFEYDLPFDCSTDPDDYTDGYYSYFLTNTAAIVDTELDDTATVTVHCYNPTVSKTADGTYDSTYLWDIDKSVSPTKIETLIGMEGTFNYTVKISSAGVDDDNFTVTGEITIVNPHPTESIDVVVEDTIGLFDCDVEDDGIVTVGPGSFEVLGYTCEDLTGTETLNEVEAAWTAYAGTEYEVSGTATADADIEFEQDNVYLDEVTIYDNKTGSTYMFLGTVSITDTLPKTFTYSLTFTAEEGCMSYTNTAEIRETGQTDTATATICGAYWAWTPGFWRNHGPGAPHGKDAWQYTGYETTDLLGSVFTLGEFASLRIKGSTSTFGSITLLDAVRLKGGSGNSGAAEILLRAGTASLLNASLHELLDAPNHPAAVAVDHDDDPLTPDVLMSCDPALPTCTSPVIYFPLTSQGVIDLVDAALAAADRSEMLALAAMLDYYNNGWEYFDWTWPVP